MDECRFVAGAAHTHIDTSNTHDEAQVQQRMQYYEVRMRIATVQYSTTSEDNVGGDAAKIILHYECALTVETEQPQVNGTEYSTLTVSAQSVLSCRSASHKDVQPSAQTALTKHSNPGDQ